MSKNKVITIVGMGLSVWVLSTLLAADANGQGCAQPTMVPACAAGTCGGCSTGMFCCPTSGGCNDTFNGACEFTTCMTQPSTICQVLAATPTPTVVAPTPTPSPNCQQPAPVPTCAGQACSGCGAGQFCCPSTGGCNDTFNGVCEFTTCMTEPATICQVLAITPTPTVVAPTPAPSPNCQQPAQVPTCAGQACSGCGAGQFCCPSTGGCNDAFNGVCEFTTCMTEPATICQVPAAATMTPTPTPTATPTPGGASPTPGGTPGHPITVINNCTETVWVGIQSSALSGGFKLEASKQQVINAPIGWTSGTIWGRTNCTFSGNVCATPGPNNIPPANCCDTGGCTNSGGTFALSCFNSPMPPVTLAEFTLDSGGGDTFDVSMVSGGNVSVSIVPTSTTYDLQGGIDPSGQPCTTNANCNQQSSFTACVPSLGCVDPFYCASPGCTAQNGCAAPGLEQSLLPKSPWDPTPGSNFAIAESACPSDVRFRSQQNQGTTYVGCITPQKFCRIACTSNGDCPAPFTCGGSGFCLEPTGDVLGANCDTTVGDTTNGQLWGCTGINSNSCFTASVDADCCGCPSWAPQSFCVNTNAAWQANAEPIFEKFHHAAPTVYSFPYDDKLGTFTCNAAAGQYTAYTVTFCPQLDTDLDGVADGQDADADNDGIPNGQEGAGAGHDPLDTDGDGTPDFLDLDSDGDGKRDIIEAGGTDADGDGMVDHFTDTDGNGWADSLDPAVGGTPWPLPDHDHDGTPDFQDASDNPSGNSGDVSDSCAIASARGSSASPWCLMLPLAMLAVRRWKRRTPAGGRASLMS